ncbi:MAG: hypothetical protein AAGF31_05290, partial [Planctomycetota bacterium]
NYFPADHWSLTGLPKVIESGPVMLVIDDYTKDDRGRVDLTKCAAVLFPTRRQAGKPAPSDAVIFEAPGGARLQFDENFQPSRGRIGRITNGLFPGQVTIRSGMREPDASDDLLISTRDVQMNETLVFTPHEVLIRHGRSTGRGRRLEIKLLEEEHSRSGGLKIAGVESIEIFEQVKLQLHLGKFNPLRDTVARIHAPTVQRAIKRTAYSPDDDGAAAWGVGQASDGPVLDSVYSRRPPGATPPAVAAMRESRQPTRVEPPLEITCAGSFRMDLTEFVATFHDRVRAWQLNLDGQSDQLTCRELRLSFGSGDDRQQVRIDPRREPEVAQRQKRALGKLQPRRLEAVGDPVKVDSPSRGAQARGRSLTFDFLHRQLTLDGGGAKIRRGENLVEAPIIRYEHPPEGSAAAIGKMWVAGPGYLRAVPRENEPDRMIEARWGKAAGVEFPVTLLPDERGNPLLTVVGRPEIKSTSLGKLTAERLVATLRETLPDGKEGPAIELGKSGDNRLAIIPERIDADGRVEVDSLKISAATDTLTVWVLNQLSNKRSDVRQPNTPLPATQDGSSAFALAGQAGATGGNRSPKQQSPVPYRLTARSAELEVELAGKRAEPTTLLCTGAVDFRELNAKPGEEPLRVRGARLRVDDLSSDIRLTIHGAAEDAPANSAKAIINARGVTLHARDAHLDQAKNRLWADGPGDATLRTTRDLFGQQTNAATDLHLSWRGGWVFDGRRITIRKDVFGQGPHDWVRTNKLIATLSQPITFGKKIDRPRGSGRAVEVAQIECRDGVTIDHRTLDEQGPTSHERAQLATLTINQQTGAIAGTGPGWVRSVRLSSGSNPLANLAGSAPAATTPPSSNQPRLRLLRVHFQQNLAGNYKGSVRQINFSGQVRTIYGPVISWQQDLPVVSPQALPPDTATLACDYLQVSEDPTARFNGSPLVVSKTKLAPIELIATGNVRMEGAADDGSVFNALANRASYNQSKELFVLEGDARSKATLWVQKPGEGRLKYPAGKISYWRTSGKVQTDNFGAVQYTPTATRPQPPNR